MMSVPVPWRCVQDWRCVACGLCCKDYDVVLDFTEWMKIVNSFGVGFTRPGISRFFLKHKDDGNCVFLYSLYGRRLCALQQNMKPIACKLWPFKITNKPKYGRQNEALYPCGDKLLYIYVDPFCPGLTWGSPSFGFLSETLTEFVDLAIGGRQKQCYSTSRLLRPGINPWKLI
jgi:Fe-S-cluster containining protein